MKKPPPSLVRTVVPTTRLMPRKNAAGWEQPRAVKTAQLPGSWARMAFYRRRPINGKPE